VGRYLAGRTWIPAEVVDDRLVAKVASLHTGRRPVADATSAEAGDQFGVTRELFTIDDYALTSRWARALADHGYAALVYQPRHSTGEQRAVAVFGSEGGRTWKVRSWTPMRQMALAMGLSLALKPEVVPVDDCAQPED